MSDETQVSPGSLESFAKYVDQLADDWNDEGTSAALRMDRAAGTERWPNFGQFGAATQLATMYEQAHGSMATASGQLYAVLTGLADATRKIAENYTTSAELANASVTEVETALAEEVNVQGSGAEQDPTDNT